MANNFESRVRKASEFNLNELKLSKRTYNCVKSIMPEELILQVRTGNLHVKGMWKTCYDELNAAIDAAGFIRHDFDARSFGAGALYRAVFDTRKPGKPYAHLQEFESNEAYEEYENFSQVQLDTVIEILDTLTLREMSVLLLRFGITDGKRKLSEEIASIIDCTRERVRQIEAKALRKLRHPARRSWLEVVLRYSSTEECKERIATIEKERAILYSKINDLEREYNQIKKYSPFAPIDESCESFNPDLTSSIEVLDLSTRAYVCLMRAGIGTIGDFVEFCSKNPTNWDKKIRNLGKKCAKEVAETVTLLGWQISVENLS